MNNKQYLSIAGTLTLLILFGGLVMDDRQGALTEGSSVVLVINEHKFKVNKEYLLSTKAKSRGRHFKEISHVDYFSFDFQFPSMKPFDIDNTNSDGWGDRVSVYVSKNHPFDFKSRVKKNYIIPVTPEGFFGGEPIRKFEQNAVRGKESSGDKDIYIYGDYQFYMSCDKENRSTSPKYPSCKLVSNFLGMEVSSHFSVSLKFKVIQVNQAINNLLESFIVKGS
ncbi:hypothetical protein [Microbulbifer sp. ANSA005]|uniref:hypothetical protein n=1 Tax=Microbulbifer sp. ANSA005 TaxID=3243362 RepID=UPI00404145A6